MSNLKDMFSSSDHGAAPIKKPIPPEEDAVMEMLAKKVVQWHMAVPAILFLESMKPLNYIGAQAMVFFEPIVQSIFSFKDYNTLRVAMERRENVENLLQKIEAHDAVSYKREKIYKKKLRQERKKWKWYQRWLGIKQPRIEITQAELDAFEQNRKKKKKKKDDPPKSDK